MASPSLDKSSNSSKSSTITYKGSIFKFLKDGYKIATPPLSYHIFQYLTYGENYFQATKLSGPQKTAPENMPKFWPLTKKNFTMLA